MKRLSITILLAFLWVSSNAQSDRIYVVFTDIENYKSVESSIVHLAPEPNEDFDPTFEREHCHFFELCNRVAGFYRTYIYENLLSSPNNPIVIKPISFLQTIDYLDWDSETVGLSFKQLFELVESINTHSAIYFIDRSEIKDGMMKMYPVKEVKSRF